LREGKAIVVKILILLPDKFKNCSCSSLSLI